MFYSSCYLCSLIKHIYFCCYFQSFFFGCVKLLESLASFRRIGFFKVFVIHVIIADTVFLLTIRRVMELYPKTEYKFAVVIYKAI